MLYKRTIGSDSNIWIGWKSVMVSSSEFRLRRGETHKKCLPLQQDLTVGFLRRENHDVRNQCKEDYCVQRYSVYVAEKPPMTGPRPGKNRKSVYE
jgi:hypothetical protein